MSEPRVVEYRGFGASHLLLAALGGAVAGAAVALLTAPRSGEETRRRLRGMATDTHDTVTRLPEAVKRATLAARDAFNKALEENAS